MNSTQASIDELLKAGLTARAVGGSEPLLATILQTAESTPQRQPWFSWWSPPSRSVMILAALVLLLAALVAVIAIGSNRVRPIPGPIRGNGEIVVHGNDCALIAYDPVTLAARSFFEGIPDCYPTLTEYTLAWNAAGDRLALGYRFACGRCTSEEVQRAFEKQIQGLWVLNPETGEVRQALKCDDRCLVESITWSPDGSRLAFAMRSQIWVARSEGGEAFLASEGVGIVDHPVWSPDGSLLLFAERRPDHPRILAVDGQGEGTLRVVADLDGRVTGLAWGRPGEQALLVTTETFQTLGSVQSTRGASIRSIDVDSGASSRLAEFPDGTHLLAARWSPDGSQLAYVLVTAGTTPNVANRVEVRVWDDSDRSVFDQPVSIDKVPHLTWSPDGEFLSLWLEDTRDFPEPGRGTYVIAADGSSVELLAERFNDQPAWQPIAPDR